MKKRNKSQSKKRWIVLDGQVTAGTVTIDGELAFLHPKPQRRGSGREFVRVISPAHVFRLKSSAIRSLKPRAVWWVRYGKIYSGRLCLGRSARDGATESQVYDNKGELQYHTGALSLSKRSAALALMADRKRAMLRAERESAAARKSYERASRLARSLISERNTR